jgi:hypothetical protein
MKWTACHCILINCKKLITTNDQHTINQFPGETKHLIIERWKCHMKLTGHQSYTAIFSLSQRWHLNAGLTIDSMPRRKLQTVPGVCFAGSLPLKNWIRCLKSNRSWNRPTFLNNIPICNAWNWVEKYLGRLAVELDPFLFFQYEHGTSGWMSRGKIM